MTKYIAKWSYGEWINGSGWKINGSDIDNYEFNTLNEAEWDEEGFADFIAEQEQLNSKSREELEELAAADSSDIKYYWTVSEWDEQEQELRELEDKGLEIWLSDVAKKYWQILTNNTLGLYSSTAL